MQSSYVSAENYFMEEVFHKLEALKGGYYPLIPSDTTFKGFKTIPIQKLEVRKPYRGARPDGKTRWWDPSVKKILCFEQSCQISLSAENGFFQAFYEAYINHGDVKITPDDIWSTVMIYFSKYVDDNAEQLRKAFVEHEDKKELIVVTNEPEEQWGQFFNGIIVQIQKNTVKGVVEQLQADFTTTDRFFRLLSTATIMNSFKKFFDYTRGSMICGIQNVHMGGTLQDWVHLYNKVDVLARYDVNGQMKKYVKGLKPILDQFIETYKGRPHLEFWNNIYQERKEPQLNPYTPSVRRNGWIIKFFTTADEMFDSVPIESIKVPIKMVDSMTQVTKTVDLVGGTKGVSIEGGHVYRPHFSFVIVEKHEEKEKR